MAQTAGAVASTTVYVRMTAGDNATISGNIALTSPPAALVNVAASGTVNALSASITSSNNGCYNQDNGTATAAGDGTSPYSYSWDSSPVQTTATATSLAAGTYICTVTDANNCTATASVTLSAATLLTATALSSTNVNCNGGTDGTATVVAGGGASPYTYQWEDDLGNIAVSTAATGTGLNAAVWTCTVTDANGCTQESGIFTITEPSVALGSSSTQTNVLCNGASTGAIDLTVTGGTTAYTYSWDNGSGVVSTDADPSGLAAATYTCTVTDANADVQQQRAGNNN